MIASRVFSIITVVHLATSQVGASGDTVKICGSKLSDMIRMMCKGKYELYFNNEQEYGGRSRRGVGGVADECCRNGCSLSTLNLYCAPSSSQYSSKSAVKRTTNDIERTEMLLNSLHSKDMSKRQVGGAEAEDAESMSLIASEAMAMVLGSTAQPQAMEDRNNNNNEETERILLDELSRQGDDLIRPRVVVGVAPRERIWHSQRTPQAQTPSGSSLSTNAVPNTPSDLRESSSAQQLPIRGSSLSNDLNSSTSSMSKPTTLPPLQIGVQAPYFLGKALIQPRTRHQESEPTREPQTKIEP